MTSPKGKGHSELLQVSKAVDRGLTFGSSYFTQMSRAFAASEGGAAKSLGDYFAATSKMSPKLSEQLGKIYPNGLHLKHVGAGLSAAGGALAAYNVTNALIEGRYDDAAKGAAGFAIAYYAGAAIGAAGVAMGAPAVAVALATVAAGIVVTLAVDYLVDNAPAAGKWALDTAADAGKWVVDTAVDAGNWSVEMANELEKRMKAFLSDVFDDKEAAPLVESSTEEERAMRHVTSVLRSLAKDNNVSLDDVNAAAATMVFRDDAIHFLRSSELVQLLEEEARTQTTIDENIRSAAAKSEAKTAFEREQLESILRYGALKMEARACNVNTETFRTEVFASVADRMKEEKAMREIEQQQEMQTRRCEEERKKYEEEMRKGQLIYR